MSTTDLSMPGTSATYRCLVRRDTYRDSVELMRTAAQLESTLSIRPLSERSLSFLNKASVLSGVV